MLKSRDSRLIFILVVLHLVGAVGLVTEYRAFINDLTPLHLLISAVILLIGYHKFHERIVLGFVVAYLVGFFVEMFGTNTGVLFGEYLYGGGLGPELVNTPLLIGINWFILIGSTAAIAEQFKIAWWLKAIVASALMVFADFLIEPTAIELEWWTWYNDTVPLQNYITWFVTAMVIHTIWQKLHFEKANKVGVVLYIIQIVFFLFLYFAL